MADRDETNPSAPAKGDTGNAPANQRDGGVKEEGQGNPDPDPKEDTPNTRAGTE